MNLKVLATGSGILVVLAALGWVVQWQREKPRQLPRVGQPLMQGVDMAQAARISLESKDGAVTLSVGADGTWRVDQQGGFAADEKKLSGFLIKLTTETLDHLVTDDPKELGALGLLTLKENRDKAEEGKTAKVFSILDKDGKPLYQVLLGGNRRGSSPTTYGGQYVRFPGGERAYLIRDALFTESRPEDWIDKTVLNVDADKTLQEIRVEDPGQPPVVFTREKAGTPWTLQGLGKEPLKEKEVKALASQIAGLSVVKAARTDSDPKAFGREKVGTVKVSFFDKRTYTFTVGLGKVKDPARNDTFRYITVSAALPPSVKGEALRQEVDAFNKRLQGRFLALYDYDAGQMLRGRKDYIGKE